MRTLMESLGAIVFGELDRAIQVLQLRGPELRTTYML